MSSNIGSLGDILIEKFVLQLYTPLIRENNWKDAKMYLATANNSHYDDINYKIYQLFLHQLLYQQEHSEVLHPTLIMF